jgi:hypothetical protein
MNVLYGYQVHLTYYTYSILDITYDLPLDLAWPYDINVVANNVMVVKW